jgi:hypothetical protein
MPKSSSAVNKKKATLIINRWLFQRKLEMEIIGQGSFLLSKTDIGKILASNIDGLRKNCPADKSKIKVTLIVEYI